MNVNHFVKKTLDSRLFLLSSVAFVIMLLVAATPEVQAISRGVDFSSITESVNNNVDESISDGGSSYQGETGSPPDSSGGSAPGRSGQNTTQTSDSNSTDATEDASDTLSDDSFSEREGEGCGNNPQQPGCWGYTGSETTVGGGCIVTLEPSGLIEPGTSVEMRFQPRRSGNDYFRNFEIRDINNNVIERGLHTTVAPDETMTYFFQAQRMIEGDTGEDADQSSGVRTCTATIEVAIEEGWLPGIVGYVQNVVQTVGSAIQGVASAVVDVTGLDGEVGCGGDGCGDGFSAGTVEDENTFTDLTAVVGTVDNDTTNGSAAGQMPSAVNTASSDVTTLASPGSLTYRCLSDNTRLELSWESVPGATHYPSRIMSASGAAVASETIVGSLPSSVLTNTTFTFTIQPGVTYRAWVHAYDENRIPENAKWSPASDWPTNIVCGGAAPVGQDDTVVIDGGAVDDTSAEEVGTVTVTGGANEAEEETGGLMVGDPFEIGTLTVDYRGGTPLIWSDVTFSVARGLCNLQLQSGPESMTCSWNGSQMVDRNYAGAEPTYTETWRTGEPAESSIDDVTPGTRGTLEFNGGGTSGSDNALTLAAAQAKCEEEMEGRTFDVEGVCTWDVEPTDGVPEWERTFDVNLNVRGDYIVRVEPLGIVIHEDSGVTEAEAEQHCKSNIDSWIDERRTLYGQSVRCEWENTGGPGEWGYGRVISASETFTNPVWGSNSLQYPGLVSSVRGDMFCQSEGFTRSWLTVQTENRAGDRVYGCWEENGTDPESCAPCWKEPWTNEGCNVITEVRCTMSQ